MRTSGGVVALQKFHSGARCAWADDTAATAASTAAETSPHVLRRIPVPPRECRRSIYLWWCCCQAPSFHVTAITRRPIAARWREPFRPAARQTHEAENPPPHGRRRNRHERGTCR